MKMKFTKKIATILLSVCLIVPCFSVMALAANGVIFFSDIETSVGDEFNITGTAVVRWRCNRRRDDSYDLRSFLYVI